MCKCLLSKSSSLWVVCRATQTEGEDIRGMGVHILHISAVSYILTCFAHSWMGISLITLWNGVFPAISINKDVTAISDFSLSNVNFWDLEEQCHLSAAISHPTSHPHKCWAAGGGWVGHVRKWQPGHVRPSLQWAASKGYRAGCWSQTAETHMKGMISVSPDSYIFWYIEEC